MYRAIFLFSLLMPCVTTEPSESSILKGIPEEYKKALFPVDLLEYIESLTSEDVYRLIRASRRGIKFDKAAMLDFFPNSTPIYGKTERLFNKLDAKRALLGEREQFYLTHVLMESQSILGTYLNGENKTLQELEELVNQRTSDFEALPEVAKQSLKESLPGFTGALSALQDKFDSLQNFAAEEKAVLKALANLTFENEQEYLDKLKELSPQLYDKTMEIRADVQEKINNLGSEAKAFIEKVKADNDVLYAKLDSGAELTLGELNKIIGSGLSEYDKLTKEAKMEFQKAFPKISKLYN